MSFVGFKLILNSQHLLKQSWSLSKCVSMSLQTLKSSINNYMKLSKYSFEVVLTFFWYVGETFFILNAMMI